MPARGIYAVEILNQDIDETTLCTSLPANDNGLEAIVVSVTGRPHGFLLSIQSKFRALSGETTFGPLYYKVWVSTQEVRRSCSTESSLDSADDHRDIYCLRTIAFQHFFSVVTSYHAYIR
jgi:hypothetical protein